ncbi:MAG: InlB B-repeat-containing protein [Bacillota bacterium]
MIKKYWILYFLLILIIVLAGCFSEEGVKNYTLSVGVQTERSGSVEGEPEKDSYQEGEEATLTTTAEEGYRFDHWEGSGYDDETDNPLTVKIKCCRR